MADKSKLSGFWLNLMKI